MRKFSFTIPGTPQHKRSGTPFYNKHTELTRIVPNAKNKPASEAIKAAAVACGWRGEAHTGGVLLGCTFYFPVPKSCTKAQRERLLKSYHIAMPDLDRLHNQIQDALSGYWKTYKDANGKKKKQRMPGLMWNDDSQVCGYDRPIKRYSLNPRTEVTVWFLEADDSFLEIDGANELLVEVEPNA